MKMQRILKTLCLWELFIPLQMTMSRNLWLSLLIHQIQKLTFLLVSIRRFSIWLPIQQFNKMWVLDTLLPQVVSLASVCLVQLKKKKKRLPCLYGGEHSQIVWVTIIRKPAWHWTLKYSNQLVIGKIHGAALLSGWHLDKLWIEGFPCYTLCTFDRLKMANAFTSSIICDFFSTLYSMMRCLFVLHWVSMVNEKRRSKMLCHTSVNGY